MALKQRMNLRLDDETYALYDKVAKFFNRTPTDLVREIVEAGAEEMSFLGTLIDRGNAGDKAAVQELLSRYLDVKQGHIALIQAEHRASMATDAEVPNEA